MHNIEGYIFDPKRMLIYSENVPNEIIEEFNSNYDENNKFTVPYCMSLDARSMKMDVIAINRAGICLTYNCNLRCKYCGYSSNEEHRQELQIEDVKAFTKDLVVRRTIMKLLSKKDEPFIVDFTGGGEPTYNWELFVQTIDYIKKICDENSIPLRLHLTTNGVLTEQQVDFISANFDNVMVSYDGMPVTQNNNRVSPHMRTTNDIVERTIKRLSKTGIPLNIRSTVWQNDFGKMKEMCHHIFGLVENRSSVTWSIFPVLFEGRAITQVKKQGDVSYQLFLEKYLDLIGYIRIEYGSDKLKSVDVPLFNNSICEIFCGAYKVRQPWLMPDKTIVTCIESKDDKTVIGEIVNGSVHYYDNYEDNLLRIMQDKYTECQDCIAYCICKGGCPIWHLRVDDDIQEPLECCLLKEYWLYIIKTLITGGDSLGWKLEEINFPRAGEYKVYEIVQGEL